MRVFLTVDVEHDCPPFKTTFKGIEEGLPRLIQLLEERDLPATFFTEGIIAERYPGVIKEIVSKGHELGCHGHTHARFDRIDELEGKLEISRATDALRRFYPVSSFRAPNLKLPKRYLRYLKDLGYKIDSSEGRHRNPFVRIREEDGILRIPATLTSLVTRLPALLRTPFLKRQRDPAVLLIHPWEFVDLRAERLRIDCRFRTGETSLAALSQVIDFYKAKGAEFGRISSLAPI